MRALLGLVVTAGLTLFSGQAALADRRVALVIGNSGYQNVARLGNPANDAAAMTATLKGAGFDLVESKRDLKISEMRRVLRDFANSSRHADISVVYYAGHGIEVDGTNYLIPVDATLEQDIDVYDEAFSLDRILAVVEPAKQLRLVILDACRDNPFSKTMKRTVGSRAIGRGLAKVEPSSPNTLIAYASKAGSTASDGDSKNSPFTTALVKHIAKPGLDLRKAFGFVRDDVLKATNNTQEPFVYGSLGGNDVTLVPAAPATTAATPSDHDATMQRNYEFALQVGTKPVWDAFIEKYPSGFFTALAKAQRDKLAAEAARVDAANKAKAAQEEQARLAVEGAKATEQAKAAEQAKATERARVAAELAKNAQEARVVEVERLKAAALAKAADKEAERIKAAEEARDAAEAKAAEQAKASERVRLAAELAKKAQETKVAEGERLKAAALAKAADKEAERIKAAEEARDAAEAKVAADKKAKEAKVAALTPPADTSGQQATAELPRSLQAELRRVGCNTGSIDGNWNTASQRALDLFNKHAGMKLEVKVASTDALHAVKTKTSRICPLICDHGFQADGERCVKISCGQNSFVNDDNECEKKRVVPRKPKAKQVIVRRSQEPASSPTAPLPVPTMSERMLGCTGASAVVSGKKC